MKCKQCGEEIIKNSEFCPYCGKKNTEKFNRIYLDELHYRNLRSNPDYYKCESCGSINSIKNLYCLHCSAPNKKLPKERKVPQIFNFFLNSSQKEDVKEEKVKKEKRTPIAVTVWSKFPPMVRLFLIGSVMLGVSQIIPSDSMQGLLSGGLALGGIGIIMLAFSSLSSKKKSERNVKKEKV